MTSTLKHDFGCTFRPKVLSSMMADSHSLHDVLTGKSITTEKRVMVDLQTVKREHQLFGVIDVAPIPSEFSIFKEPTKTKENSVLRDDLMTSKIAHPIAQYITWPKTNILVLEKKERWLIEIVELLMHRNLSFHTAWKLNFLTTIDLLHPIDSSIVLHFNLLLNSVCTRYTARLRSLVTLIGLAEDVV